MYCITADLVYHLTAVPILGSSPPDLFSHNTDCSPITLDWDLVRVPLSAHVEADVRHASEMRQPNAPEVMGEVRLTQLTQISKKSNTHLECVT